MCVCVYIYIYISFVCMCMFIVVEAYVYSMWRLFYREVSSLIFPELLFCICFHIHFCDWSSVCVQFSSVQFSRSVVSDSLQPHESQHTRPPCPSPTPWVHSDSCPSSPWCHPAVSSSVVPFSSCPQSLPASESFPVNQLFAWGGQSTGVLALASFIPKKSQDWSLSEWTGWIPCSPRDSQESSPIP